MGQGGHHDGFAWEITQSQTTGYRNRHVTVRRDGQVLHGWHVDEDRYDGNPRYVQDEIDRLRRAGIL